MRKPKRWEDVEIDDVTILGPRFGLRSENLAEIQQVTVEGLRELAYCMQIGGETMAESEIAWLAEWPQPDRVREEVEAYVATVTEVLTRAIPESSLKGLYYKGSALKQWESALDYVPEVSDVDFHVWFASDEDVETYFGSMDFALDVQAGLEHAYEVRVTDPIHGPRPQFVVLNQLLKDPSYAGPPSHLVLTLVGDDLAEKPYNTQMMLENDCERAQSHTDFLAKLPGSAVDKPGRLMWKVLRDLTFRVSPAGPWAAHFLGAPTEVAWESNRTQIYHELIARGRQDVASAYADYYTSSWGYFLSDWKDTAAGRTAIRKGIEVIELTSEIASRWAAKREGDRSA